MSITLQELAFVVEDWAANTANIPLQSAETVIEDMLPTALQTVALKAAGDPRTANLMRRNFTVALVNGTGTAGSNILTSYAIGATVYVPAEPTVGPLMSYVHNWSDFIGPLDTRLGYWTFLNDDTMYWIDPGATFNINSGRTGNITLNIASVPAIPATETTALDMPDELVSNLVAYMKDMLVKEINPRPIDA